MELPKRKPMRLQGFNYDGNGAYFITICTCDKRKILCDIVGDGALDKPIIRLSKIGEIAKSELLKVVIYNEIKKALDNNTHQAILQCNYDCTKHQEANAYNLIRFVEKAKHQNALTNIYITVKKDDIFCKCTVSANKAYQQALEKADYNIVKHFKTVKLEDLTNEIKTLYAIFNSTH